MKIGTKYCALVILATIPFISALPQPQRDLQPRRSDIFRPQDYQNNFQVPGSPYWIACNYGETLATWLIENVLQGLGARLDRMITNNGGSFAQAPHGVLVQYQYELPQIALNFGLRITMYGAGSVEWIRLRSTLIAIAGACVRGGVNSLLSNFVLYGIDQAGHVRPYWHGEMIENDVPLMGGGRRLIETGNITSVASSNSTTSKVLDLATIPNPDGAAQDATPITWNNLESIFPLNASTSRL